MYGKLVLLIAALSFGNPSGAAETGHDGHDQDKGGPTATGKPPATAKPAEAQGIEAAGKAQTCKPHKASKVDCFICDPALRDKGRLWCKEHARYEDRCFLCHPEIKDAKRLYCEEHGLYEDECFLCHPELKKSKKPGTPSAPGNGKSAPAQGSTPKKG